MRIYKLIVIITLIFAHACLADEVVKGVLTSVSDTGYIKINVEGEEYVITPNDDAKIMRAQMGRDLKSTTLEHFAMGDTVVALIGEDGKALSLKAYFDIISGVFDKIVDNVPYFEDGRAINIAKNASFVFPSGIGNQSDLQKGMKLTCRINPNTTEAWTIISDRDKKKEDPVKDIAIDAIFVTTPSVVAFGEKIYVKIKGTPKCKATFDIDGLFPTTPLIETLPGVYEGAVTVPNKIVSAAPVVGRISSAGKSTQPLQAAKLITTIEKREQPVSEPLPDTAPKSAEPIKEPEKTPPPTETVKPQPIVEKKTEPEKTSKKLAPIIIKNPGNNTNVTRRFTVAGTAEPNKNVTIHITYTNGLVGIMNLSGTMLHKTYKTDGSGSFKTEQLTLDNLFASRLIFTLTASYSDNTDKQGVSIRFIANNRGDK